MQRAESRSVHLRSRGVLTLPKSLRDKYDLEEGDALYLVDAGGAFVLTPMEPMVPSLSAKIEEIREETGLSIDELLNRLQEERAALARDRYGAPPKGRSDSGDQQGAAGRLPADEAGEAERDSQTRPGHADE